MLRPFFNSIAKSVTLSVFTFIVGQVNSIVLITSFANATEKVDLSKAIAIQGGEVPQGGTFQYAIDAEPETLSPLSSYEHYAEWIHEYTQEGLLKRNSNTNEFEPSLALSYQISKDKMTIEFRLRPDVTFHDGRPLTSTDVKFSVECVRDPRFKALHRVSYYENIGEILTPDPLTVIFKLKEPYFLTLEAIATVGITPILPQHVYGDPLAKTQNVLVGTGPYKFSGHDRGKNLTLVRYENWWGRTSAKVAHAKSPATTTPSRGQDEKSRSPGGESVYNFGKIIFRFIRDEGLRLSQMESGQLDLIRSVSPEAYTMKMNSGAWGKTAIRQKVSNLSPKPLSFVGWNLREKIFASPAVRVALAHLANRPLMIEKFLYGMMMPATGPWYRQSPYADESVLPISFDPKKAEQTLTQQGWVDSDKDGVRDKLIDGQRRSFRFALLYSVREFEKYLTVYQQDLRQAGIAMELKLVDWSTLVKSLNEGKFEAAALAWGGSKIDIDPKQIWHSSSIGNGGSNYVGYANKSVDKWIDQVRKMDDRGERIKILKKVYRTIASEAPYLFLFNREFELYAHSSRMGFSKPTQTYDFGFETWWLKE